jgi:glycosyltransferase involved in cell wall biosynthesis
MAIIAVSEFTRREVIELLAVREERVHVAPNGVGIPFTEQGPAAAGDYVLAVGTLEPRKNLSRLVRAFQLARLSDCELRVVGARGWGGVEVRGARIRWLGPVPDEELARLYRGALCVAYVSLYEGFGLPVLEAMACGAPVVASNASALVELGGDAVVSVDPRDPEAIAQGLEMAIGRSSQLRIRGLERARQFTWRRTAEATSAVYEAIAA